MFSNGNDEFVFGPNFNFGTGDLFSNISQEHSAPFPPVSGSMLLLDNTHMLLLDGTDMLLT